MTEPARPLGAPEAARPATAREARRHARMLEEVRAGLSANPRTLPPKYFYDATGSALFEEITQLPEYYLTRTERGLLERWAPEWIGGLRPRTLVELGAGSAAKTRILLDAMLQARDTATYVPVDISAEFLARSAGDLRREYPELDVRPLVADIAAPFEIPTALPRPLVAAFLGSSIGNFEGGEAVELLRRAAAPLQHGDRLLLGADLRKDPAILEPAYDDAQGVTARFNRNVLHVLNRELGADFEPDAFAHRAVYDRGHHWIEMHLVATRPMVVHVPGAGRFVFREGDAIRTETSAKYDRASLEAMLGAAGLRLESWITDPQSLFVLVVAAPAR